LSRSWGDDDELDDLLTIEDGRGVYAEIIRGDPPTLLPHQPRWDCSDSTTPGRGLPSPRLRSLCRDGWWNTLAGGDCTSGRGLQLRQLGAVQEEKCNFAD